MLSDCLKLKRKQHGQNESKPTGLITSSRSILQFRDIVNDTLHGIKSPRDSSYEVSFPSKPIMETFEPFIHDQVLYHWQVICQMPLPLKFGGTLELHSLFCWQILCPFLKSHLQG